MIYVKCANEWLKSHFLDQHLCSSHLTVRNKDNPQYHLTPSPGLKTAIVCSIGDYDDQTCNCD
jgi:hypothetical protein